MLFNSIIYGPIHSRRLGVSLGVNLLPADHKLCTFNCAYCECGWNTEVLHPLLPTREQVKAELEQTLSTMTCRPDVITFSGNGEPTLHPQFENIMTDTCTLRDKYCPDAKVCVLSNSTQLSREDVVRALLMADQRILKLDSAITRTMRLIDQPVNHSLQVEHIKQLLMQFNHDFTLQTCLLRGTINGKHVDNTSAEELAAYYDILKQIAPKQVMIYVIDRQTPCNTLQKIEPETMQRIAADIRKMGIEVIVSV